MLVGGGLPKVTIKLLHAMTSFLLHKVYGMLWKILKAAIKPICSTAVFQVMLVSSHVESTLLLFASEEYMRMYVQPLEAAKDDGHITKRLRQFQT